MSSDKAPVPSSEIPVFAPGFEAGITALDAIIYRNSTILRTFAPS